MPTLAQQVAAFATRQNATTIPAAVRDELAWHALDTVGVCLAALTMSYPRMLLDIARREGGRPEATLLGTGLRAPARTAAFFNGCLGHGVDYDDTHLEAVLHPTATVFPAMLALAEKLGRSGADLLAATALGIELMTRTGLAGGKGLIKRGVHPTSSCGAFGVAYGASWLLGLDEAQTVNALGIAGAHAGGLHESTIDGSWNKCIHSGLAAQAGLLAADLATRGFTGPPTVYEGSKGFFRALAAADGVDLGALTRELGERWEAGQLAYKVYPCCQGIHGYADCALDITQEAKPRAEDIEAIEVRVSPLIGVSLCEPAKEKTAPPTAYGAKFSIPFTVASALMDGRIDHDTYSPEKVAAVERIALARRVRYVVDEDYSHGMALRGYVRVTLRDGRVFERQTDACRGTPQNPWSHDEVVGKFMRNSVPIVGRGPAEQFVDLLPKLGELGSLESLTRLMHSATANAH